MELMNKGDSSVVAVVVPLPAQSHLNQLLHLARLISSHGIPVHYAAPTTHNRQARERAHHLSNPTDALPIAFHDLPLPPFANPPLSPNFSAAKFPNHLQPLFQAALETRPHISNLIESLMATSRRVVVIHDSAMTFVASLVDPFLNVETYAFHSVSAFAILFYLFEGRRDSPEAKLPDLALPRILLHECFTEEFLDFLRSQHQTPIQASSGHIMNTSRAIEDRFVDLLVRETGWEASKTFAIGPLNPVLLQESHHRHECLDWLDLQPLGSVLYVSFGTLSSLSNEEITELAIGLEESKQRFVWVVREADRADIYEGSHVGSIELPSGFERRVEGRGVVVRGWAPQLAVLGHRSTGGFLSHCGWNSCMESMSMGVPMLAWPLHSDQPRNAILVTEVLKMGIMAREWSRREEIMRSKAIGDAILRLMVGDEGKVVRERAKVVGHAIRLGLSEGGTSRSDFDSFITQIKAC